MDKKYIRCDCDRYFDNNKKLNFKPDTSEKAATHAPKVKVYPESTDTTPMLTARSELRSSNRHALLSDKFDNKAMEHGQRRSGGDFNSTAQNNILAANARDSYTYELKKDTKLMNSKSKSAPMAFQQKLKKTESKKKQQIRDVASKSNNVTKSYNTLHDEVLAVLNEVSEMSEFSDMSEISDNEQDALSKDERVKELMRNKLVLFNDYNDLKQKRTAQNYVKTDNNFVLLKDIKNDYEVDAQDAKIENKKSIKSKYNMNDDNALQLKDNKTQKKQNQTAATNKKLKQDKCENPDKKSKQQERADQQQQQQQDKPEAVREKKMEEGTKKLVEEVISKLQRNCCKNVKAEQALVDEIKKIPEKVKYLTQTEMNKKTKPNI